MARNSRRVRESSRNAPSIMEVTMVTPGFMDAARRHALMRRLDHHGDALGLQNMLDAIGDLRAHLLLHLQAARIGIHHAGELGDADHLAVRQIADMGAPDDRRQMMLAMRFEPDVAQHHHFVIALDLLEGALKKC